MINPVGDILLHVRPPVLFPQEDGRPLRREVSTCLSRVGLSENLLSHLLGNHRDVVLSFAVHLIIEEAFPDGTLVLISYHPMAISGIDRDIARLPKLKEAADEGILSVAHGACEQEVPP